jgi:hypothetical protein
MKAFRFSLERALSWRRMRLAVEEARLQGLHADLSATERTRLELPARLDVAAAAAMASPQLYGATLAELEAFRVWSLREGQRLAGHALEIRRAIQRQMQAVGEARRQVRLIERLKERRHEQWKGEAECEIEALAGELSIAQWTAQKRWKESVR